AVAVLAKSGVMPLIVGEGAPQWYELRAETRRLGGEDVVDVTHVGGIGTAARDRVAAPDDPESGVMQCREDPVGAFGIGLAPRIGAEMHRRPVRVPHFQP